MKEIYEKNIEIEEKREIDIGFLKKRSSGKTPKGIVLGYAKRLENSDSDIFSKREILDVFRNLFREVSNLELTESFRAKQWRGKSGVKFIISPDKVIAERYRKVDIGEKPKKVSQILLKQEINKVILAINNLNKGEMIKTSQIAELVYSKDWKQVFSTRKQHCLLVEILNYLEYRQDIHYSRGGKIKVLGQTKLINF